MMILGIVLHSAVTYSPLDMDTRLGIFQLKDPFNSHISNGFIVEFIHSFRIQVFFLVAGFLIQRFVLGFNIFPSGQSLSVNLLFLHLKSLSRL